MIINDSVDIALARHLNCETVSYRKFPVQIARATLAQFSCATYTFLSKAPLFRTLDSEQSLDAKAAEPVRHYRTAIN